jgi:tetratricopeptide (TPR) repeat protein
LENDANSLTEYDQKSTLSSLVDIYQEKVGISANENEKVENILAIIKLTEQLILVQENIDHIDNYWYYQSLGDLYYQLSRYDDLYVTYEKVLEYRLKNPSTRRKYLGIIDDCEKLVSICVQYKNDYRLALKNQLMKHKYIMKYAKPEHGDDGNVLGRKKSKLAESHDELADTYTLLAQYDSAKENFNLALKLHQEMLTEYQKTLSGNEKDKYEKDSIEKLMQGRRATIEITERKLDDVKNRKQDETVRNYVTMF